MEKTVIDYINTELVNEFSFLQVYGFTRISQKKDGGDFKNLPTTINIYTPNCNTDKEVYIMPNRDKEGICWWELNETKIEKIFQNVKNATGKLKLYVWLNTDKINQEDMNDTTYMSQFANAIPYDIPKSGTMIRTKIQNITTSFGDNDFKKYTFDKMFARKPYVCFSITMDFSIFYSCLSDIIIKQYDECGNIES